MGFPTKNDHFGVFWGYPYFWKHPNKSSNQHRWQVLDSEWHDTVPVDLQQRHLGRSNTCSFEAHPQSGKKSSSHRIHGNGIFTYMNGWLFNGKCRWIYHTWILWGWWFQIFLFSPLFLGKWSNLTNTFEMGWFNHQLEMHRFDPSWKWCYMLVWQSTLLYSKLGQKRPQKDHHWHDQGTRSLADWQTDIDAKGCLISTHPT